MRFLWLLVPSAAMARGTGSHGDGWTLLAFALWLTLIGFYVHFTKDRLPKWTAPVVIFGSMFAASFLVKGLCRYLGTLC